MSAAVMTACLSLVTEHLFLGTARDDHSREGGALTDRSPVSTIIKCLQLEK
jgi:hypothetical protein